MIIIKRVIKIIKIIMEWEYKAHNLNRIISNNNRRMINSQRIEY